MKKISFILVLSMILCLLAGCGENVTPDTSSPDIDLTIQPLDGAPLTVDTTDLKRFDLECGLSLYAQKDLEIQDIEGMDGYISNSLLVIMVIREPKDNTVLSGKTLQDYADLLTDSNGIPPCVTDTYGNLATAYLADSMIGSTQFYYYMTVKETEDSFWLIQMACPDSLVSAYSDTFAQWSATVVPTESILPTETTAE